MKASQIREFDGVLAAAMIAGEKDFLEVDDRGYLSVPSGQIPTGFNLVLAVQSRGSRRFVAQKDVGQTGGGYGSRALAAADFPPGFKATAMHEPIQVTRAGSNTWTVWHADTPNRMDVFYVGTNGDFGLYQIGVFTHDDGQTWRLHGEPRWVGQLFKLSGGGLVAVPRHPKWGDFEGGSSRRTQIFSHPEFLALVKSAKLKVWKGQDSQINPPLPEWKEGQQARIQWYITFASQKGAGIAEFPNGKTAWVQSADIRDLNPEEDGEIRLWRGDVISFESQKEEWGHKGKKGPSKLLGVRLQERPW